MLVYYLFFVLMLSLMGACLTKTDDYISKDNCNSMGIFILVIFLTHSMQNIKASGYTFSGIDSITSIITGYTGSQLLLCSCSTLVMALPFRSIRRENIMSNNSTLSNLKILYLTLKLLYASLFCLPYYHLTPDNQSNISVLYCMGFCWLQ